MLVDICAGIQAEAPVQVRVVRRLRRIVALDFDRRDVDLAAVQLDVSQVLVHGLNVYRSLSFDAARGEAEVEMQLLLQHGEGRRRGGLQGVIHRGDERQGGGQDPARTVAPQRGRSG